MDAYCENSHCRVVLFTMQVPKMYPLAELQNCPGCGRMGRTKDEVKS